MAGNTPPRTFEYATLIATLSPKRRAAVTKRRNGERLLQRLSNRPAPLAWRDRDEPFVNSSSHCGGGVILEHARTGPPALFGRCVRLGHNHPQ